MHQSKLITVLRTLQTRERSRWREYVFSPYFNKNSQLRALADALLPFGPDFDENMPGKADFFARVYGAEATYDELKLNNLLSDLYALLLGFLAVERLAAEPLELELQAANALLDRNLEAPAAAALAKCRSALDRRPGQTSRRQFFELRWWEASEVLESRRAKRVAGEHLYRQARAADAAFVLEKLRLGAALLSRQGLSVLQGGEPPRWLAEVRNWCRQENFLVEMPTVQVYLRAFDLLEQPNPEHFSALTASLDQHYAAFEPDELAALYQYALNYCIRRINAGQPEAYAEALALYQTLLDRGVLLRQGRLSQWTFKNITTAGLRSGAFAWTEQFLNHYRALLPPSEQENAYAYNLAALYFEKEQYTATLLTLQNVEFTDFSYHLGAKIMQLKSYYLLDETEALQALLEATQQLLRRNRSLSAFGKTANLNFIRMLRLLLQWKHGGDTRAPVKHRQQQAQLLDKMERLQPLANKDWLQDMLDRIGS